VKSGDHTFYAAWRETRRPSPFLHDARSDPPEKLLQAIWQQQRLRRQELQTAAGRGVRILHPGFPSVEGGPDFRGAVLQFENEKPVAGDVEIDVQPGGWRAHGHDQNPAFKNVILHVVWEKTGPGRALPPGSRDELPVLALKPALDAPLAELAAALENESGLPAALRGKCSAPLRDLSRAQLSQLLRAAARVRFEAKAEALRARARQGGWEQALWENLFRALGYKHNAWPMQNLAETRSRWQSGMRSAFDIQARLLGISGLLPAELTRRQKSSDTFLRRAWDVWWRDRDEFAPCTLPRTIWKFHGLRPANHPQRRLALAAHWLAGETLIAKIETWCTAPIPAAGRKNSEPANTNGTSGARLLASLEQVFQVDHDEFWSWHWTFQSARLARAQPLLGAGRVTDLAVNVILPWLWVRAREGGNETLRQEVERRFLAWPDAGDNAVLKLARQRLLGTAAPKILQGAAEQQGLMQIVRDFCGHSNAICDKCRFPELVRSTMLIRGSTTV
jgi:hypothetical protein